MTANDPHAASFDEGRTVLLGGGRRVGTRITGTADSARRSDEFRYSEFDPLNGDPAGSGELAAFECRLRPADRARDRDRWSALRLPTP